MTCMLLYTFASFMLPIFWRVNKNLVERRKVFMLNGATSGEF